MSDARIRRICATGALAGALALIAIGTVVAAGSRPGNFKLAGSSPEAVSGDRADVVVSGKLDDKPGADLALVNSFTSVAILSAKGGGNFTETGTETVGQAPIQIAVAKLDGDNAKDLAVASLNAGTVTILLSDGEGGFSEPASSPEDTGGGGVAAADFDDDGDIDLAVGTNSSDGVGHVYLNDGSADFTTGDAFSSPGTPRLAAGDFDGDHDSDVAAVGEYADTALVSFNDGDGNLSDPITLPGGAGEAVSLTVGKVNGDKNRDIAVAKSEGIDLFLSDGEGGFDIAHASPLAAGSPFGDVAIADVDGDRRGDVLGGAEVDLPISRAVRVFLSRKHGHFKEPKTSPEAVAAGNNLPWLALGKFDDRKGIDVAAATGFGGALSVLLNRSFR